MALTNDQISELFAGLAESAEGHRKRAYLRAARQALLWPEEAADLASAGRSLTELPAIGPSLGRRLHAWLDDPPAIPEVPELRRDFLTVAEARRLLANDRSWRQELRADLQMHTTSSDGTKTLDEMADGATALGYEYIAITDHTKGLKIAGGMNEDELEAQGAAVAAYNERRGSGGCRVLWSTEMNLSPQGEGDMDPALLVKLDLVLGSFHSQLQTKDDQTERYIAALRNPYVHIVAHPRGRKYNRRLGLNADWERVVGVAAELDKAIEINAYPDRQDLQGELLSLARDANVRISIGTDAHSIWELDYMEVGLANALKAGIAKERILNFAPVEEILEWAASHRAAAPV